MNKEATQMLAAIQNNELELAQELFERSVMKSSAEHNLDDLYELAETLHQLGFLDEARDAYKELKLLAPAFGEWDISLAEIAIDQDRQEEALDILLSIDKEDPVYPQALLALADVYQVMGLYEVSEAKIREARQLLPDEPLLTYALAQLYYTMGEYKKAAPLFLELLESGASFADPSHLYILLGDCYHAAGSFEEALFYLEKVPEESHTVESRFQLGFIYFQLQEFVRAAEVLRTTLLQDENYAPAYLYLAYSLEEQLEYEEALGVIQQAISVNPYQYEFYLEGANLLIKLRNEPEAEAYYQQAMELEPELSAIVVLYVNLLLQQERYEEVIDLITKEQQEELYEPQFYWQKAKAYREMEAYPEAGEAYRQGYSHFSSNLPFLLEYLSFLREEGRITEYRSVLHEALLEFPGEPTLLSLLDELQD